MKTHLLIDGDVVAYSAASAAQSILIDDFGWAQPFANTKIGEALVENMLSSFRAGLEATSYSVYLSDPSDNWRWSVDPNYKRLREEDYAGKSRPILLAYLKDYLREAHGAVHWPGLEADDVLGVLMTTPAPTPAPRQVMVGLDKDFGTIPGLHHQWRKDLTSTGGMALREVSLWEADRFHLIQTLAGDRVDGFPGCPGIGMERAAQIIDNPTRLVPQEGVKTRGVNKGESVTRWFAEPTRDYWACIVSHYRKAGLGEAAALVTARLARILRHGEYDPATERLELWTPELLLRVGK